VGNAVVTGDGHERLLACGGVVAVLDVLRDLAANPEPVADALFALGSIADNKAGRMEIVRNGGIAAVVSAMKKWRHRECVVERGASALSALAVRSIENQRAIAAVGAFEILTETIVAFEVQVIVEECCSALWNLLSTKELYTEFMSPAILNAVELASRRFPQSQYVMQCLGTIKREEHPASELARKTGACTLVGKPMCSDKRCDSWDHYWCADCSFAQCLTFCKTCAHKLGQHHRLCVTCAKSHNGHELVVTFRPGTCDSRTFVESKPPKVLV
jgi:hypothetical protein